jgi:hypothetical protein
VATLRSLVPATVLFTLLCLGATWFALGALEQRFSWPHAVVAAWFLIVSLLLHRWQERDLSTDIRRFMRRFMTGLVLKLLASLALLALLLFLLDHDRKPFMIVFVLWYLAFLGFSTARLVLLLKRSQR